MSNIDKIERAILELTVQGRIIAIDRASISAAGKVLIPVDGIPRTHNEMYAMADMPLEPE